MSAQVKTKQNGFFQVKYTRMEGALIIEKLTHVTQDGTVKREIQNPSVKLHNAILCELIALGV